MSLRGIDTPDTLQYLEWFKEPPIGDNHVEQGYVSLCKLIKGLGLGFNFFLFFVAFTEMEIWVLCTKRILPRANANLLLALCISFYGIYFWGCVIRASIAITIAYIAFTFILDKHRHGIRKWSLFYILIFVALLFHKSSIIYAVCPLFILKWKNYLRWGVVLGAIGMTLILQFSGIGEMINIVISSSEDLGKFHSYASLENDANSISLFWIVSLVISVYILFKFKVLLYNNIGSETVKRFFINLYIAGFALLTLTIHIPAGSRLGMMYTFFEFVVIFIIGQNLKKIRVRYGFYIAYMLVRFANLVHSFPLFLNY